MFINIEVECLRRRMSKKDLAASLSVRVNTVNAWINGQRGIPADKLRALSRLFGCSVDYLLKERR